MALESYKSENLHLIKEALDYTQVGLTVTDPSLPDNPLIYVNKGFLDMTGYQETEVLGGIVVSFREMKLNKSLSSKLEQPLRTKRLSRFS